MPEDSSTTAGTQPVKRDDSSSEDEHAGAAASGGGGGSSREAKRLWTPAEDDQLVAVVNKYGASRWSLIATHVPGRAGKQCRERWFNHLCPEVKKGDWSPEEDETLLCAVAELGSQWSIIVKRMPGRTDNAIKNRYNTIQRRARSAQAAAERTPASSRWPCHGASPDGASPIGSGSSAGTPKRRRDHADGGSACAAVDALAQASMEDVFGALLEGMPTPCAPSANAALGGDKAPASPAHQTRSGEGGDDDSRVAEAVQRHHRERIASIAADIAACDAGDVSQHAHMDHLLTKLTTLASHLSSRPDATVAAASGFVEPGMQAVDVLMSDDGHTPTGPTPEDIEPDGARTRPYLDARTSAAVGPEASTGKRSGLRSKAPSAQPFGALDPSPLAGTSSPRAPRAHARTRRVSSAAALAASRTARARSACILSLSPLHIDDATLDGNAVDSPSKRARASASPAVPNGPMGEAAAVEDMIEQLFPDAAGLAAGDVAATDLVMAASQGATPCAGAGGPGGTKVPLTPSSMLNALVDAF